MNVTKEEKKTFFGSPIEGDIQRNYRNDKPQKSAEELHALLTEVLSDPGIEAVRWIQYTPYFNDGDPCYFRIGESSVKLKIATVNEILGSIYGDDFDPNDEDNDYNYEGKVSEGFIDTWSLRYHKDDWKDKVSPSTLAAVEKFESEFGSSYENVTQDFFGDHAEVIATKDKFTVEFYEHE